MSTTLSLDINSEFTIHSSLTFGNVEHFDGLETSGMNDGHGWYNFVTYVAKHGEVAISIYFNRGQFDSAKLSLWNPSIYGSSWSDWTEQKQRLCALDTKRWLSSIGYNEGNYAWGSLWIGYDPKSAHGYALIQNKKPNKAEMATPRKPSD